MRGRFSFKGIDLPAPIATNQFSKRIHIRISRQVPWGPCVFVYHVRTRFSGAAVVPEADNGALTLYPGLVS